MSLGFILQTAPRGGHGQAHSADEENEALSEDTRPKAHSQEVAALGLDPGTL